MAGGVTVTLMALVVSLVVIYVLLPQFNVLANKSLPFSYITQPDIMLGLLALGIFSFVPKTPM